MCWASAALPPLPHHSIFPPFSTASVKIFAAMSISLAQALSMARLTSALVEIICLESSLALMFGLHV